MIEFVEPHIVINGTTLSVGQAATVRIAVATFLGWVLSEKTCTDLGDIGPLYRARASEIMALMLRSAAL